MVCQLEPLDEAIDHWPAAAASSSFGPFEVPENEGGPHIVIPNVSPGRWRLTLKAVYDDVFVRGDVAHPRPRAGQRGGAAGNCDARGRLGRRAGP